MLGGGLLSEEVDEVRLPLSAGLEPVPAAVMLTCSWTKDFSRLKTRKIMIRRNIRKYMNSLALQLLAEHLVIYLNILISGMQLQNYC